jgi:hypothetical protein
MKITDTFTEKITQEITRFQLWTDGAKEALKLARYFYLLPDLDLYEEFSSWNTAGFNGISLNFRIPWNPDICDGICLIVEKAGWNLHWDCKTTDPAGKPVYYRHYYYPSVFEFKIEITMSSSDEKSTCKLVQVGTTIKELPVWEVRCGDMDEENE